MRKFLKLTFSFWLTTCFISCGQMFKQDGEKVTSTQLENLKTSFSYKIKKTHICFDNKVFGDPNKVYKFLSNFKDRINQDDRYQIISMPCSGVRMGCKKFVHHLPELFDNGLIMEKITWFSHDPFMEPILKPICIEDGDEWIVVK